MAYTGIETASECYGPTRNVSLYCQSPSVILVEEVSLGISQNQKCLSPASDYVFPGCCTPKCNDCMFAVSGHTDMVKGQCDGLSSCTTATEWKRVDYNEMSKCAGKLTNYMTIAYACKTKDVLMPTAALREHLTKDIICNTLNTTEVDTMPSEATNRVQDTSTQNSTLTFTSTLPSKISSTSPITSTSRQTSTKRKIETTSSFRITSTIRHIGDYIGEFDLNKNNESDFFDTSSLRDLAKHEAIIFGSTAASAVIILLFGVVIGWLFCRRRTGSKSTHSQYANGLGLPVYAYGGESCIPPNYHYDCTPPGLNGVPMMQMCPAMIKPHHFCSNGSLIDAYGSLNMIPGMTGMTGINPTSFSNKLYGSVASRKLRSSENHSDDSGEVFTIRTAAATAGKASQRNVAGDTSGKRTSVADNLKPEFQHYIPVSEAEDDEKEDSRA